MSGCASSAVNVRVRSYLQQSVGVAANTYAQGEKKLSYAGLCKALTEWKAQPETLWLKETHSQPL